MTEGRTTQDSPRLDPFDFWRQVYDANEQAWSKTMKEMLTSQGYAEAQGKMLETLLVFQKMMRDAMSAQLNNLNIPTRDDISRLGEILLSLEEKVDSLEDQISALSNKLARETHNGDSGGQVQSAFETAAAKTPRPPAGRTRPNPEAPGTPAADKK